MATVELPEPQIVPSWQTATPESALAAVRWSRRAVLISGEVDRVTIEATGEPLPPIGSFSDHRQVPFSKFELPAAAEPGEGRRPAALRLKVHRPDGSVERVRFEWKETAHPPEIQAAAEAALATLTDRHEALLRDLSARAGREEAVFRAGQSGAGIAIPVRRFAELWREHESGRGREPELVRDQAAWLESALEAVCHRPRTALLRRREFQDAGRIREVDATCLRWLARQPGATVAEKAGARRQAMGIVRREHIATLENRVVAAVIRMIESECRRVLADPTTPAPSNNADDTTDNGDTTAATGASSADPTDHEAGSDAGTRAVDPARHLLSVVERLKAHSPIASLAPPAGAVRPNHALQRDPRYRELWRAYVSLQQRHQQSTTARRWRQRLWAESCVFAVLAALHTGFPDSPAARSCLALRRRPRRGRRVDPTTAIGRWEVGAPDNPVSLLLIERRDFQHLPIPGLIPENLQAMSPDFILLRRTSHRLDARSLAYLGVWCHWTPDRGDRQAQRWCEALAHELQRTGAAGQVAGMLLEPMLEPTDNPQPRIVHPDPAGRRTRDGTRTADICRAIRMPLPLVSSEAALRETILSLIT